MRRSLLLSFAAVLMLAMTGSGQGEKKKSALDKATIEAYVRHLYVMDSRIKMQVGDPKPSTQLPGFFEVGIHASMGQQSQDFTFLVSKDGSKILQATVYDVDKNPFKSDLDKIKTEFEPSIGTPGAPVVLVEFSDFQCPYCKQEAQMLRQNLLTAYPKQVRLYFKTFPLESLHPWSRAAAIASKCVSQQSPEMFWEFHDWIFENQAVITPPTLKDQVLAWAKDKKGVDALQLGQCIETKATDKQVEKDLQEGQALNIGGTPTLFVNGRRIPNVIDWANLRQIIDFEIEYQKTAKNAGEDCGCETQLNLPGMTGTKTPSLGIPKK